jgi:methylmalonyl-CoA mutase, C-terminal domain
VPAPRLRVLLGKTGLDGHDRGVLVIGRMLRDAGHEVIYLGRRRSTTEIARAARDEDVDVVGLSVLSGTHNEVSAQLLADLRDLGVDVPVVIGGTILHREIPALQEIGVAAVFPVATPLEDIREWFETVAEKLAGETSSPGGN